MPLHRDVPICVALAQPPAFVDVNVLIAGLGHPVGDHRVCLRHGDLCVNGIGEAVPRRPTHRRRRYGNLPLRIGLSGYNQVEGHCCERDKGDWKDLRSIQTCDLEHR
jgi:hypothetical protein